MSLLREEIVLMTATSTTRRKYMIDGQKGLRRGGALEVRVVTVTMSQW